ncbi:GNAT family N-acetyltransferase [Streptomyces sp. NPDC003016]
MAVHDGEVVATTGVRSQDPAHPPHPRRLAERYPSGTTAQLVRVYVRPEHRRRGPARTTVGQAGDFAAATPGYDSRSLRTNVRVKGAETFWRSIAEEVFDALTTGSRAPVSTPHRALRDPLGPAPDSGDSFLR